MKTVKIADLGEVITGHTPPTKERDYYGDLYPLLKPTDMRLNERYSPPTEESVSAKWVAIKKKTLIPRHATCVVTIGTIGKICIASGPCFTNQAVNSVIPDRTLYDEMYIYYLLKTVVPHVKHLSSGTASGRENVSKSAFSNIEVTVHDLPTQRKIASILSAYDDLIENNTRRIAILEEMAEAIYREWFVNFRFPGHENVKLVESPLGKIPEGWKVGVVNDLLGLLSGFAFKSNTFVDVGNYKVVTIKNVHDGVFDTGSLSLLDVIPDRMPGHCQLETGDVLMSLTGNIGRTCLVFGTNFLLNQRVAKLQPHRAEDIPFVYWMFRSSEIRQRLEQLANGVAQQNLSPVQTGRMEIPIPTIAVRNTFAEFTSSALEQILNLNQRNHNLCTTRDLLLPKLISGQLDVEDLDIETSEPLVEAEA